MGHSKDEFLDTVTHELRTPITAIRAASEILHDDDDDIQSQKTVSTKHYFRIGSFKSFD
jgi:signal transduction histidine kinase